MCLLQFRLGQRYLTRPDVRVGYRLMRSLDTTISKASISEFEDTTQSLIDDSPQMNESNTKVKIIQPFLQEVLGYGLGDMELEYKVQMGGQTYRVDYALMFNEIPEVFVEAKGLDTSITTKDVDQLKSYLKLQDVTWGLLTNGQEYKLYQLEFGNQQAEFHLLAELSIGNLSSHRQTLSAISKRAIERGEAEDVVRYIREVNRAKNDLTNRKSELAEIVANAITAETTDVIYQEAEREAKELIDRLVQELSTDYTSGGGDTGGSGGGDGPSIIDTFPTPDVDESVFPVRSRVDIDGDDDAHTALYASQESGIEFLSEFKAWGFIDIAAEPDYFLIYLSKPFQHVRYLGVVEEITPADEFVAEHDIGPDEYKYNETKKVIEFSELFRLEDPIPIGPDNPHRMQGLLYTTLGAVKSADTTDDL